MATSHPSYDRRTRYPFDKAKRYVVAGEREASQQVKFVYTKGLPRRGFGEHKSMFLHVKTLGTP